MITYRLPKAPPPLKTSLSSPIFADGRIVTAEDLHLAMSYPLDAMRIVMRAYFGCGIVCGLELATDPKVQKLPEKHQKSRVVRITPGVAIDCHGHPIELCGPVALDLSPDPCDCGEAPEKVCIAIRRLASDEQPRAADPCGCASKPADYACSRRRERVEIKVYLPEDPPDGLCWHKPEKDDPDDCGCNGKSGETELVDPSPDEVCKCLKTCGDCHCCGESWIYLGCVDLTRDVAEPIGQRQRRYIKPIDCLCRKVREEKPKPESEPPATPPKGTRSRNRPRK
jgi:hypothetical protein